MVSPVSRTMTAATTRPEPGCFPSGAGAPVVVETPAEGQARDVAYLRERLAS